VTEWTIGTVILSALIWLLPGMALSFIEWEFRKKEKARRHRRPHKD
jgi:hypothetical protein